MNDTQRAGTPLPFGLCVALLTLGLALLLLPIGGSGSLDRAEPYFLDAGRAMVESGDWLVPHYRGQPFFDKPILGYWVVAAALRAFGYSAAAARLGPGVFAVLTLLATITLGTLVAGRRAGLFAGLALATTVPFVVFGRTAMADMPMTFCSTVAIALAVAAFSSPERRGWLLPLLGAALGLGFSAKGPIAVLLPGLAIVALAWHKRRAPWPVATRPLVWAGLLFCALGFGWFVAIYFRFGAEPLQFFFLQENLQRFAAQTYDAQRQPFFYVFIYLTQGLPWALFLPLAAAGALRSRAPAIPSTAGWIPLALLLMALPLSLSRGKLDYYLLPVYPLACVLVGAYFATEWDRLGRLFGRVACLLVAGASLGAAALLLAIKLPPAWLPPPQWLAATGAVAVLAALTLGLAAGRPSPARVAVSLAASTAVCFALLEYVWMPAFAARQPNRAIVQSVQRELAQKPDARFALCGDPTRVHRDIIFETAIPTLETCELWGLAAAREPFLLLMPERRWRVQKDSQPLRVVGAFLYLPAKAFGAEGFKQAQRPRLLMLVANYATSDAQARRVNRRWQRAVESAR